MTVKEEMKLWYFDLLKFKPEVGFEFRFGAKESWYFAKELSRKIISVNSIFHKSKGSSQGFLLQVCLTPLGHQVRRQTNQFQQDTNCLFAPN